MRSLHVAVCLMLGSPCLSAQPPEAAPGLSGPHVEGTSPAPTLIRRDFEGRLVRPAAPVEAEALKLLNLDDASLEPALAIITERARQFDRVVVEHLDLVLQAEATFGAGTVADKLALVQQIVHALDPVTRGGPLDRRVRAALPAAHRRMFDSVLREYWDAVVVDVRSAVMPVADTMMAAAADEPQANGADAKPEQSRFAIVTAERAKELGQEIERAVQRQIKSGGLLGAVLTKGMTLSEDQRARVTAACGEFQARTGENPTPAENLRLAATLMPIMDEGQRKQLIINVSGYQPPGRKPKPAAPAEVDPKAEASKPGS